MGSERPYCVVCGRIRFVVAAGLLISVLFVTRTEIDFIKGLDLNEILFRIIFGAFIVICGFKIKVCPWFTVHINVFSRL